MEDAIDVLDRPGHGLTIQEIGLDELDLVAEGVHIREMARAEVVQNADLVPSLHEGLGNVGANEPGAAGD